MPISGPSRAGMPCSSSGSQPRAVGTPANVFDLLGYCGDDCNQRLLLSLRTQGPGMLNSLPQEQSPCNKELYCQNAYSISIEKDGAFLACVLATLSSSASLKSKSIYSRKPSPSTSLYPFYFPLLYSYGTKLYSFL